MNYYFCSTGLLSGEFHALLLLALVAEPDADDVLFEVEFLGNGGDFLARGARLDGEIGLERSLLRRCDRRPLALLFAGRKDGRRFRIPALVPRLRFGFLQPGVEDRLQGDHVVVRQRQRFKPDKTKSKLIITKRKLFLVNSKQFRRI